MSQLPMLRKFSMAMARQIISKVILIHAHAFLALGPETGCDLALVVFFYHEILVFLEVEVRGERHAAFAFSYGLGHNGRVKSF